MVLSVSVASVAEEMVGEKYLRALRSFRTEAVCPFESMSKTMLPLSAEEFGAERCVGAICSCLRMF